MAPRDAKDNSRLDEILAALREEMPNLEKTFHVKSLGVFGPYARRKDRPRSTLNLVVEYYQLPSLFKLVELEIHLSNLLGVKVDLGTKSSIRPAHKEWILNELVPV